MDTEALTQEELDAEQAESLPDREAMSVLPITDPIGEIGLPVEPPESA